MKFYGWDNQGHCFPVCVAVSESMLTIPQWAFLSNIPLQHQSTILDWQTDIKKQFCIFLVVFILAFEPQIEQILLSSNTKFPQIQQNCPFDTPLKSILPD